MTTPDITALEAAYRDACVKAFEAPPRSPEDHAARYEAQRASDTLQRAKAASEDEGIKAVLADFACAVADSRYGEGQLWSTLGRVGLEKIRAAGYEVRREQQP